MDYSFARAVARPVEACDNRRELALLVFARSLSSRWPLFWHKNQCRLSRRTWISTEEKRAFGQSPEDVPGHVVRHQNTQSLSHAGPCPEIRAYYSPSIISDRAIPWAPHCIFPARKHYLWICKPGTGTADRGFGIMRSILMGEKDL